MRTDGQIECEQRKKEMLYWLSVPLAQIAGGAHEAPAASDLPPGVREGTRAAQIYRALPAFGAAPMTAREIATSTGCAKGLIAPVLTAMDKAGQLTRIPAGVEGGGLYGYTRLPPAVSDSEGGDIDIQNAQPEVAKNTGSSASGSLSPSEGAAVQPEPAPAAATAPSAAAAAADVKPPQYDPRSVAFSASTRLEAEKDENYRLIGVLADIRAAVGDREGRLMQDELVERVRYVAKSAAIAHADLDAIRAQLLPLVYTGDPANAPGPAKSAEHAAQWIQSLSDTNREQLAAITCASETLAPLVLGDIDTSDMDLQEIAEKVAAVVNAHDDELLEQAKTIIDLRNQLGEERTARQAMQEQIDELQREAMRGATCLSGKDRYTAAGYLVRAPKRPLRTFSKAESARAAAMAAARNGSGRGEVFALVPAGKAVRGAEWRPA